MTPTVIHSSFTIERLYPVPPERVFAAFADPAKKRRWYAEGERTIVSYTMDFRVGGRDRLVFTLPNGLTCVNDTTYLDIVPNQRIVVAYTMSIDDKRFSSSHDTFEFLPTAQGTTLLFTEQAAFFEGSDGPKGREHGWGVLLTQLAEYLSRD